MRGAPSGTAPAPHSLGQRRRHLPGRKAAGDHPLNTLLLNASGNTRSRGPLAYSLTSQRLSWVSNRLAERQRQ